MDDMLREFSLTLASEGISPKTVVVYTRAALWLQRATQTGWGQITRADVRRHIASILETRSASYANQNFRSLQAFFRWLEAEEGIANPMAGLKAPRIPPKLVPVVEDDSYKRVISSCDGKSYVNVRDRAILEMFRSTGARLAEITCLNVSDVDLDGLYAIVTGKGSKPRVIRFDVRTGLAVARYVRARRQHRYADSPRLWLGERGPLTSNAVYNVFKRRCQRAGVKLIHPHQMRHTFSHQWLLNGGQETDLMAQNGWSSHEMLRRYGASAAAERARIHYDKVMGK